VSRPRIALAALGLDTWGDWVALGLIVALAACEAVIAVAWWSV
jgi:hypothetical protein